MELLLRLLLRSITHIGDLEVEDGPKKEGRVMCSSRAGLSVRSLSQHMWLIVGVLTASSAGLCGAIKVSTIHELSNRADQTRLVRPSYQASNVTFLTVS